MRLHPRLLVRSLGDTALAAVPPRSFAAVSAVVRIEGSARAVFDALHDPTRPVTSRAELASCLAERFDAPVERVRADLDPLLDGWVTAGIVVDDEVVAPPGMLAP